MLVPVEVAELVAVAVSVELIDVDADVVKVADIVEVAVELADVVAVTLAVEVRVVDGDVTSHP